MAAPVPAAITIVLANGLVEERGVGDNATNGKALANLPCESCFDCCAADTIFVAAEEIVCFFIVAAANLVDRVECLAVAEVDIPVESKRKGFANRHFFEKNEVALKTKLVMRVVDAAVCVADCAVRRDEGVFEFGLHIDFASGGVALGVLALDIVDEPLVADFNGESHSLFFI